MDRKIKLLLVDDEERFLQTLSVRLGMRDFDVVAVSNGKDAVEIASKEPFDLALVDLKMPGMSGEEVLELLKARDPHVEVIILTGHGSIDSAVQCTKLGSYGYLQKPCETEDLLRVLTKALQRRVQKKAQLDGQRLQELMSRATGESPLAILRRIHDRRSGGD